MDTYSYVFLVFMFTEGCYVIIRKGVHTIGVVLYVTYTILTDVYYVQHIRLDIAPVHTPDVSLV